MATYAIHEGFYSDVEKKLNRIARKCEKYGNAFTCKVVGAQMRNDKKDGTGSWHKFVLVEVEGTAKVGNWEFVATLDVRDGGNVVRRYNTEIELPERFQTSPNVCEHCRSSRARNNLYVVRNAETGEFKQVGGNCLASYTHGLNLEYVVSWIDGLDKLCETGGVFYGESAKRYHSVDYVVSLAAAIIGKTGYFNAQSRFSTRAMVCTMLRNDVDANTLQKRVELLNDELKGNGFNVRFSVSDFTADNSEQVSAILDYYKSLEDGSEFVHNIQVILNDGYATYKDLGFLCYLPQGYAKHIEQEVERAKRMTEKRTHYGEIGKRYKNVSVQSVRKVACYSTEYGVMNVWQIIIKDGVVLTWKSSVYPEDDTTSVSFTVKEHGEYKGAPQTLVTRCKFCR